MDDVKKVPCVELPERISKTTTDHNDRRLVAGKPSALDFRIGLRTAVRMTCLRAWRLQTSPVFLVIVRC